MPFEVKKMDGGWLNVYMYNVLRGWIISIEITDVFFIYTVPEEKKLPTYPSIFKNHVYYKDWMRLVVG